LETYCVAAIALLLAAQIAAVMTNLTMRCSVYGLLFASRFPKQRASDAFVVEKIIPVSPLPRCVVRQLIVRSHSAVNQQDLAILFPAIVAS
jgi:hypothetical protein